MTGYITEMPNYEKYIQLFIRFKTAVSKVVQRYQQNCE